MEERSLILEGLPDDFDRVKSKVELYFKNKRRSGGEIVQIQEHQEDKRKALLIYMNEEGESIFNIDNLWKLISATGATE